MAALKIHGHLYVENIVFAINYTNIIALDLAMSLHYISITMVGVGLGLYS